MNLFLGDFAVTRKSDKSGINCVPTVTFGLVCLDLAVVGSYVDAQQCYFEQENLKYFRF